MIYFIIFYSLLFFFKFYLEWIQNIFSTSTDLQMRQAHCQHQLSFLYLYGFKIKRLCIINVYILETD